MKISELARASGVSVPTVKFYLREGLLHPGTPVSRTRAEYDSSHVDRLRLLRALRDVGNVPINRLRQMFALLDTSDLPVLALMAAGVDALNPPAADAGSIDDRARQAADEIVAEAGWTNVRPDAPDRARLAALLSVVASFGTHEGRMDVLRDYIRAADRIGRADIANLDATQSVEGLLSEVVIGQVVFGEILLTLRRLAEEHYACERFPPGDGPP